MFFRNLAALVLAATTLSTVQAEDIPNSFDHPEIGRFPQSEIRGFTETSYGEGLIPRSINSYSNPESFEAWKVQGKRTTIVYELPSSVPITSLEVIRSLKSSLQQRGFSIEMICHAIAQNAECGSFLQHQILSETTAKNRFAAFRDIYNLNKASFGMLSAQKGDLRLWAIAAKTVYSANVQYAFDIYEEGSGNELTLAISEDKLRTEISTKGSALLQGVEFESNSAALTSASNSALKTIADYLKANPGSRFLVVGHTDNQGTFHHNRELSEARAQSVKRYLMNSAGIESDRLRAIGVAFAAPIASNDTAAGQARNRRVELVLEH
ncbi:OmpA family protein [Epibacterium ulvae]|uniref:OmpA family protein n=1 Tax=Epibacterium ulvae TaxID=1156985 RepID=UPI002491EE28|nr:OmpA family protein [Epibacterium ulvae]